MSNRKSDRYKSYPLMFKGRIISKKDKTLPVQLVQVADILEAMINTKPYQTHYHKKHVLDYIYSQADIEFSSIAVSIVKKFIAVYTINEEVILNDGRVAVIKEQTNINNRPIILIDNEIVDLSKTDNLYITNIA